MRYPRVHVDEVIAERVRHGQRIWMAGEPGVDWARGASEQDDISDGRVGIYCRGLLVGMGCIKEGVLHPSKNIV